MFQQRRNVSGTTTILGWWQQTSLNNIYFISFRFSSRKSRKSFDLISYLVSFSLPFLEPNVQSATAHVQFGMLVSQQILVLFTLLPVFLTEAQIQKALYTIQRVYIPRLQLSDTHCSLRKLSTTLKYGYRVNPGPELHQLGRWCYSLR